MAIDSLHRPSVPARGAGLFSIAKLSVMTYEAAGLLAQNHEQIKVDEQEVR